MTQRICKTATFRRTAFAAALAITATPGMAQMALEEVIVTAQKREASLQDISATVNVVTGDALDKFSSLNFEDIEAQTAGLTLATPNARNQNVAMRGVAIDTESGADGTVDVYWNGQLVNTNIAFSQLYDMERIEVLKGPQGTLQGRASPGGAINILTRQADTSEASGYVQMTVGDNEGLNTQVAYGMPLIEDTLGVRVAAVYDTSEGRGLENPVTGLDDPEVEAKSARLSTTWNVTDDFAAELSYQYFDRDSDDPAGISGTDSLSERPTLKPEDETALASTNNEGEFDYDMVGLNMSWEVAGHELVSVTGWSDQTRKYHDEVDRANYVTDPQALTFQSSETKQEIWSQELRLASSGNDFWDYMVGLYYLDQDVTADFLVNDTTTTPPETQLLGEYQFTLALRSVLPVTAKQWSIFTFNSFYLRDDLQLEVGLRYTDYDKTREATVDLDHIPYMPDIAGPLPPGFTQEQIKQIVVDQVAGALPIEGISPENQKGSEDAWTGSAALRWDWTDDVSLYASYNRGYRPSGTSIVPAPATQFLPDGANYLLHDEEESDAFEVGFKGRFMDNRASLNGAVFYQQYDGYLGFVREVEVLDDEGLPQVLPGGIIFNGDANIFGVELEGRMLLTETWDAGGGLSWIQAEWDGAEMPCNDREGDEVVGTCDVDGENIGGEPEWSATLNSEYYYPLDNTEIYVRGLYKFTGERDNISASAGLGDVTADFDAYSLVDLFVGWRSSDYTWDVNLFAKNLFDEDELIQQLGSDKYDQQLSGGSYTQTNILNERTIGLTARYNF